MQNQTVATLVAEGIIGVAEVVQIEVAEGQATAFILGQARSQQGLESLAIGNAGQGILIRQAVQGVVEFAVLTGIAQAATQHLTAELMTHQPVADTLGLDVGLGIQQQDYRQGTAPGGRQVLGGGEEQGVTGFIEQRAGRLPGRCGDQRITAAERTQTFTQQLRPARRFRQQQQA